MASSVSCYLSFCGRGSLSYAQSTPNKDSVPALFAFGDSVVDTGNNNFMNTLCKANFAPYGKDFQGGKATGRFSDGKLPCDLAVEALGIKEFLPPYLDPSLQIDDLVTGVNFASSCSGFDPVTSYCRFPALSLTAQLSLFDEYKQKLKAAVGENRTAAIVANSIYLIATGVNDFLTYLQKPPERAHYSLPEYLDLMVAYCGLFLEQLYAHGARKIAVMNLPPVGCVPIVTEGTGTCLPIGNDAPAEFNPKLQNLTNFLNDILYGSKIVILDIFTPLDSLVRHPLEHGFLVTHTGCCGTNLGIMCAIFGKDKLCSYPSAYVFWDGAHPTEATYKFLYETCMRDTLNSLV